MAASTTIARISLIEAIRPFVESPRARGAQRLRQPFCALNLALSACDAIASDT